MSRKIELDHPGKTHAEILREYWRTRTEDEQGIIRLNDAEWLEDVVFSLNPYLEARNFLWCGGEAIVIQGYDYSLDRLCVLKIPRPDLPEVAQKRFVRSARVLANLNSRAFPQVYYISIRPFFLLLDWTVGITLRAWTLSEHYDIERGIEHVRHVLSALAELHAAGVVHRDIRPDNILIDRSGKTKIIDFGMAKTENYRRLTTCKTLGTWSYSPPEQLIDAGSVWSPSADVYSAGLTALFVFTKWEKLKKDDVPDPRILLSAGLPAGILGWFGRTQELAAQKRHQSCSEALEEYEKIFPPPLPSTIRRTDDLYSLIESLLVLVGGDLYFAEILTAHFLSRRQLLRLWKAAQQRRAEELS